MQSNGSLLFNELEKLRFSPGKTHILLNGADGELGMGCYGIFKEAMRGLLLGGDQFLASGNALLNRSLCGTFSIFMVLLRFSQELLRVGDYDKFALRHRNICRDRYRQ